MVSRTALFCLFSSPFTSYDFSIFLEFSRDHVRRMWFGLHPATHCVQFHVFCLFSFSALVIPFYLRHFSFHFFNFFLFYVPFLIYILITTLLWFPFVVYICILEEVTSLFLPLFPWILESLSNLKVRAYVRDLCSRWCILWIIIPTRRGEMKFALFSVYRHQTTFFPGLDTPMKYHASRFFYRSLIQVDRIWINNHVNKVWMNER